MPEKYCYQLFRRLSQLSMGAADKNKLNFNRTYKSATYLLNILRYWAEKEFAGMMNDGKGPIFLSSATDSDK